MDCIAPGYLLTWHTYGTWLHGDEAGSVERSRNQYGTPRLSGDGARFERVLSELRAEPLVLSQTSRVLVDCVMRQHCLIRQWDLRALAVRSNHVHVVIGGPRIRPEPIVKQLKEWGTRKLREHRVVGAAQPVWAEHASTIYLFEPGTLERAVRYVLEGQEGNEGREGWDFKLGLR